MQLIDDHKKDLITLCKKHKVKELFVFGSVLSNRFKRGSDIDFLVRFEEVNLMDYFDNYMDFKESLEKLFNREVDLVEVQTVKNPILERTINRNKTLIYERKDSEMAI